MFAFQSGRADGTPEILAPDEWFTALVGAVPGPVQGTYDSVAGEVLYLAVPIEFADPQGRTGVIVAAYLGDAEREPAHDAARGHLDAHDPADVASTVELVDDELDRMNRMVSDRLLLARSAQPTFLHPELTDVGELTEDVFGEVVKLGERERVLETAARVDAEIDPQRVTQAIVALADNAVRCTRPGDRSALGSQLAGGELRFWVADSGPGISEADRTRIFERLACGTATGPRSEGARLGLTIIRAIAVAHGGQVLLDSVVGRGSTFTVAVLPGETP